MVPAPLAPDGVLRIAPALAAACAAAGIARVADVLARARLVRDLSDRSNHELLLGAGALGALLLALRPGWRGPVMRAWLRVAGPVGVAVNAVLLTIVYLLVLTPVGLVMRALGKDPLARRWEPGAASYWTPVAPRTGPDDPFRRY